MKEIKVHVIKIKSKFKSGYLDRDSWDATKDWESARLFQVEDINETKRVAKRYEDGFDSDCNLKCVVVEWTIKEKVLKI